MSYQVLARKWRPRFFHQVVGQEHAVKVLVHALARQRVHHAYLFTGTRGVGKTTLARILAKAFNCEALNGTEPCGECTVCRDVDSGRCVDLIEVDAASRTRVEDTRELLENVQYAPTAARFKVYLIDEVHMLSGHSFNALLKTLEEPPDHVRFLLATTDPQKIPVTVLSRCLQLNLKMLTVDQLRSRIRHILDVEEFSYDSAAVDAIADAASGSMRDGLSLLDQAIALGDGTLQGAQVNSMLGVVSRRPLQSMLLQIAAADAAGVFEGVHSIAEYSADFTRVLQQMLVLLRDLALLQFVPSAVDTLADGTELAEIASRIPAEDLQLFYQIALTGQRDLALAPSPRVGFEMLMLRMLAFRPLADPQGSEAVGARGAEDVSGIPSAPAPAEPSSEAAPPPSAATLPPASKLADDWVEIVRAMNISGMAGELAANCVLGHRDESECVLLLDPGHQQLRTERVETRLQRALQEYFALPLKLKIQCGEGGMSTPASVFSEARKQIQNEAERNIETDDNVRALCDVFDATIVPGSTRPVDRE